ncbi:hypothetical protein BSLG_001127 [Batrachochytrium salamandrivorans]|nr:hypothetical protein BSLG_001127 [Batrachochytrium salamandrivorans]
MSMMIVVAVTSIQFQSETRLVSTDMCVDNGTYHCDAFTSLRDRAATLFHLDKVDFCSLGFKWQDADGDWIIISSVADLVESVSWFKLGRTRQHAAQRSSLCTITTSQERVGGIHPLADHCMRLMLVFLNPLSKLIHITDKALVMHDLESMISHHVSMNDLHTTNQDIYSRIIELVEKMASSVDKKPVVSSPVLMPLASPNTSEPLHTDSIHTYSDLHPLLSSETDCTLDVEASSLYQTPKLHDLINLLQYPTIPTSYMQPSNTHMDMLSCHDIDVEDPIAFDLEHLMQCVNNLQKDYPINYAPSLLIEYVEDTPTSVVSFTSAIGPLGSHDSRLSAWGSEDPALLDSGDSLAVPMFDDDFAVDDFVLVDF